MWRTACAFGICAFGVGLLDHMVNGIRPQPDAAYINGKWVFTNIEFATLFLRLIPAIEIVGIAAIVFAALQITRPGGLLRNEYPLLMLFGVGLILGRSFIGIGEGWSTDLLIVKLPGILIALAAKSFIDHRKHN